MTYINVCALSRQQNEGHCPNTIAIPIGIPAIVVDTQVHVGLIHSKDLNSKKTQDLFHHKDGKSWTRHQADVTGAFDHNARL